MLIVKKITIIEDDDDIRTIAETALEAVGGFSVQAYPLGIKAVEDASQIDADLIILDVMMPVLDGPSTLERLRQEEHLVDTPVIFMTAKAQKHEVERFLELGALGVIEKPFDPMQLATQIEALVHKYNGHTEG